MLSNEMSCPSTGTVVANIQREPGSVRWTAAGGVGIQHALLGAQDTFVLTQFLSQGPPESTT
jgi:hypothetical protein